MKSAVTTVCSHADTQSILENRQEERAVQVYTFKHHQEDSIKENSVTDEKSDIDEYTTCKLHLSKSNGLKLGHLTVRSITDKMDEVRFVS